MGADRTRIAIIDDEEDLCYLLSNMLKAQGFDVSSYYTLSTGLLGLKQTQPHWVIIDNDLPDGRGWASTDDILDTYPGVNIIKISANPDSSRTHFEPNVHYLIKPIHVNSIVELINRDVVSSHQKK
jgi:DNA-binding NtrC family response regulator